MKCLVLGAWCLVLSYGLAFGAPDPETLQPSDDKTIRPSDHSTIRPSDPLSDTELWNEGVDYYRSGDATNALRVLRPLILSKEYGARAAEVVAALVYDRAHTPGEADALPALEEAAAAAQLALRAAPKDERARRNFARSVDGLAELRRTKHINDVLAAAQGKDPGALLKEARDGSRRLMAESATCRTNAAPVAVALADALSARAENLADAWLPVKELIAQSVTNEEQAATISMQVDAARDKTARAARELADLDANAYASLADAEHDFTRFHKMVVMPPDAMQEDLVAQSNAWQDVEAFNGRAWQTDALDYTRAFRLKFPAWAQQYEQQAQADTNKPPFTAEAQAQISALSTELEKLQIECEKDVLPPKQEEALDLIRQIIDLLPKDNAGGGGQSGQQSQNQQQDKNQQQPDGSDNQQNEKQDQQGEQDRRQEENPEQSEPEADGSGEEPPPADEDKDVEAVLKKAQERADEHEAEKKARMRKAPLPPNERDW